MSIPKNITTEHIDRAINEINIDDIPKCRPSNTYFLISGDKRLPPKYVKVRQINMQITKS